MLAVVVAAVWAPNDGVFDCPNEELENALKLDDCVVGVPNTDFTSADLFAAPNANSVCDVVVVLVVLGIPKSPVDGVCVPNAGADVVTLVDWLQNWNAFVSVIGFAILLFECPICLNVQFYRIQIRF